MPQSLYVFAVSLQEHPELLTGMIRDYSNNVKSYYYPLLLRAPAGCPCPSRFVGARQCDIAVPYPTEK